MKTLSLLAIMALLPGALLAQPAAGAPAAPATEHKAACGGSLETWRQGVAAQAKAAGVSEAALRQFSQARIDERILGRDRSQTVYNITFADFSKRVIPDSRLQKGRKMLAAYKTVFDKAQQLYGVPGPVIAALWGLESDYGTHMGDDNTLNALFTLAYDCRRAELFRPQLIALLQLFDQGVVNAGTTGAWAGEIGHMQVLPLDYLTHGVDGDGDGKVDLVNSVPDSIMTIAHILKQLGWKKYQPWLQEVTFTSDSFPWHVAGDTNRLSLAQWSRYGVAAVNGPLPPANIKASLLLPMGHKGPAFLIYRNFDIFVRWNHSTLYATTMAYFATRLAGAPAFRRGKPEPGLTPEDMKQLQMQLSKLGYATGKVDGVLGVQTRDAVRRAQLRLKMPADGWPTQKLLKRLQTDTPNKTAPAR